MVASFSDYEQVMLALCIWREARGQNPEAQRAVGWVIRNRVTKPGWWGTDWLSVILKPWQFSSFNRGDPNSILFPSAADNIWTQCLRIASEVYEGKGPDPSGGATSYHDISVHPSWTAAQAITVKLGAFVFYKQK